MRVKMKEIPMNRLTIRLEHDSDTENPLTECDGQWTLKDFTRDGDCTPEEVFTVQTGDYRTIPNLGIRRKLKVGLAFMLDMYEHGGRAWSLRGQGYQCQWDTSRNAGVLVWEHKPGDMGAKSYSDRMKDAQGTLDTFNAWLNGDCVWFAVENADEEWVDSCGGYIGPDYAYMFDEIRSAVTRYMADNGFTGCETVTEREYEEMADPEDEEATFDEGILYLVVKGDASYLTDRHDIEPKPEQQKAA